MSGSQLEMTPEEAQAVVLVWESRGNQGPVPEDQVRPILSIVRKNAAQIEAKALRLGRARWVEDRWFPRRHMAFFMLIVLPAALIAAWLYWALR